MKFQRLTLATLLAFCLVWIAGCGSDFENEIAGDQGTPTVPTGSLVFNFVLARTVPAAVTNIRFTGLDANGNVVFGPVTEIKASPITLNGVPVTTVQMLAEFLQGGTTTGHGFLPVTVTPNQTTTITDPPFTDGPPPGNQGPPTGPLARLTGDYVAVGGFVGPDDTQGHETNFQAQVNFDGRGNITAGGGVKVVLHDITKDETNQAGTYTVDADGNFTATITTQIGVVEVVDGRLIGDGAQADMVIAAAHAEAGVTQGILYLVRRGSGMSNATLNGNHFMSGFNTPISETQSSFAGDVQFDGAGNINGQFFDNPLAEFFNIVIGSFNIGAGSTYTVADNGDFTASLNVGTPTPMELTGVVGANGVVLFTNVVTNELAGNGIILPTPAPVTPRSSGIRAQVTESDILGLKNVKMVRLATEVNCVSQPRQVTTGSVSITQSSSAGFYNVSLTVTSPNGNGQELYTGSAEIRNGRLSGSISGPAGSFGLFFDQNGGNGNLIIGRANGFATGGRNNISFTFTK